MLGKPPPCLCALLDTVVAGAIHVLQAFSSLGHHHEGMLQLVTDRLTQLAETTSVQAAPAAAYSHQHAKNSEHNQQVWGSHMFATPQPTSLGLAGVLAVRNNVQMGSVIILSLRHVWCESMCRWVV